MLRGIVLTLGVLVSVPTWAATTSDDSGPKLVVGGSYALGNMKNSSGSLASRTINVVSARAFPGWSFGDYMIGVMGQGRWVGQLTGVSDVGGTNVTGLGYYFGAGGLANWGDFVVQATFDFLGNLSFANKTPGGDSETLSSPIGFTALVGYKFWDDTSIDLHFALHNFGHTSIGGVDNDISSDKISEIQFGLGISYQL